jgi:hypothetical protein
MMVDVCTSEMSVYLNETTWRYIPEAVTFGHIYVRENKVHSSKLSSPQNLKGRLFEAAHIKFNALLFQVPFFVLLSYNIQ